MILNADNLTDVGSFLKARRETLGIRIYPLSYKTGLSGATIHYAEKERNLPTLGTLVILADALGLEIEIREKQS